MLYQSFVLSGHSEILFFQVVGEKKGFSNFFLIELNYLKLNIFNPVSRMQTSSCTHPFLSVLNASMSVWLFKYFLIKKNNNQKKI